MANYKLFPLVTFHMENEYSMMIDRSHYGEKKIIPVIFWLIQGEGHNILVDSGVSSVEKSHYKATQTEEQKPENLIKSHGLEPKDIEAVILTHLHWDHCYNLELFPNAKIYVQKRELLYAFNPLPCHWMAYESVQSGYTPTWPKHMDRFIVLDGDFTYCDGIEIFLTPGHSPGMQNVVVQTSAGKYLIASDNIPLYENWNAENPRKHIASNIHYDLDEYYKSLERYETICDFVLPGHDILLTEKYTVFPEEERTEK